MGNQSQNLIDAFRLAQRLERAAARGLSQIRTARMGAEDLEVDEASFDFALAYSKFDDATRKSVRAEYLESIAPYKAAAGYAIPGKLVIATDRRA